MVLASEEVTVGSLISGTLETLRKNSVAAIIYIALLTVGGIMADVVGASPGDEVIGGILQIALAIFGIVAQYLLYEAFLKQAGLFTAGPGRRYLAFVGLAIVSGLGIGLGILLLIVPGLILLARWSVAAALLVGEHEGVFEALRRSREITKGHTITMLLAMFVLFILFVVMIAVTIFLLEELSLASIIITQLLSNTATALALGFSVAALGLLHSPTDRMTAVFE